MTAHHRQRISLNAREAAALDRLLDAYLATDEEDPGLRDLAAIKARTGRCEQDHSAYRDELTATPDQPESLPGRNLEES